MKVAMIDRVYNEAWYTWFLCRDLSEIDNSVVICYGPKRGGWDHLPGATQLKKLWSPHLYPFQIGKAIRKDEPDIVHIQFEYNTFGLITSIVMFPVLLALLRTTRARIVVTLHSLYDKLTEQSLPLPFKPGIVTQFSRVLLMLVKRLSDGFMVHFPDQKASLVTEYQFNASRIAVIPHGTEYLRGALSSSDASRDGTPEILYFGNITPRKGIDDLMRAVGLLRTRGHKFNLTVAGKLRPDQAWYLSELKALAVFEGLEGVVTFPGFIEAAAIPPLMANADVVVFPHREVPSASGSLATAKGIAGKIVITDHPRLKHQLGTYPATTASPNDPHALAAAIIEALEGFNIDFEGYSVEVETARDSWKVVAEKLFEFYQEITRLT
jgi:glycosyltransferase involved in cell wall biosynthesis